MGINERERPCSQDKETEREMWSVEYSLHNNHNGRRSCLRDTTMDQGY